MDNSMEKLCRFYNNTEERLFNVDSIYKKLKLDSLQFQKWAKENIDNNINFIENIDWIKIRKKDRLMYIATETAIKHIALMSNTDFGHKYRNCLIDTQYLFKDTKDFIKLLEKVSKEIN